ncbi:hypothetical protein DICA1_C06106 [Diutina catenulata]
MLPFLLIAVALVKAEENPYSNFPSVAKTATLNGFADPIYPNLAPCAQKCLEDNKDTGKTPCPYWDTGCLCVMPQFANPIADCIAAQCVNSDVKQMSDAAVNACSAAGVWDPFWMISAPQKEALAAAAAKPATTTSTSEAPTSTSAAPAPTSTSESPVETTPAAPETTEAPETTTAPEPTANEVDTGVVAPESAEPEPSVEASEEVVPSAEASEEVVPSAEASEEPVPSAEASAEPSQEASAEESANGTVAPESTSSDNAISSAMVPPPAGNVTVTEDKTVTDIVFYCPETTTVTLTKCDTVCQPVETVCEPGTVTVTGTCVVPGDYTPATKGQETVTVAPPAPKPTKAAPIKVSSAEEKPAPTVAGENKPAPTVADVTKTAVPTVAPEIEQQLENGAGKKAAGSFVALAAVAGLFL